MITTIWHSRKMTFFKVAAAHQNRMNLRSPHQLLFVCYCRQPCPYRVAAGWRHTDRHMKLPLEIQSAAYITWWVNRSVRVGQDWCKRVCWQAEISCPNMSYARFQWHIFAPITSVWARRLRIPSPPRVTSCPPRQCVPIATETRLQSEYRSR